MGFLKRVSEALEDAFEYVEAITDDEPAGGTPNPVHKKAYMLVFDPRIPNEGNKGLIEAMNWQDPDKLAARYIQDLKEVSNGYANYSIVKKDVVDAFPPKVDGFVYDPNKFAQAWRNRGKIKDAFHKPDWADYHHIIKKYDIIRQINEGVFDELWMFGFPYGGFYESRMAGPGAFWCNAPALDKTDTAERRFVIMGFSYQRGVGEMLENMGHRAESIMKHVYRRYKGENNLWEKFTRYDQTHPGEAEVGLMHFAPNSTKDYEWGRDFPVACRAHTWKNFPDLQGVPHKMNCNDWGHGDTRLHHRWWFDHLPNTTGRTAGILNNWWEYIIDPDTVL